MFSKINALSRHDRECTKTHISSKLRGNKKEQQVDLSPARDKLVNSMVEEIDQLIEKKD